MDPDLPVVTVSLWRADAVVLFNWLMSVDLNTVPIGHAAQKQALVDLLSRFEQDTDVPEVMAAEIDAAQADVAGTWAGDGHLIPPEDRGWSDCFLERGAVIGPAEGLRGCVAVDDVAVQFVDEVVAACEVAMPQHAAGQGGEDQLDLVEPGGVGRGEVRSPARMCREPRLGVLGGV